MDLLIFDLDGTLVDSREDIIASVNWTIERMGGQLLPREIITAEVGRGVKPLLKRHLPLDRESEALQLFDRHYLENLTHQSSPYAGVVEMLRKLEAIPKVVLTNKEERFALPLLRSLKLERHFLGLHARETFAPKPSPQGVLGIVAKLGARLSHTLMIGDMPIDIEAGRKAGSQTCAALYGYGQGLDFSNSTFQIRSPLDLLSIARKI